MFKEAEDRRNKELDCEEAVHGEERASHVETARDEGGQKNS